MYEQIFDEDSMTQTRRIIYRDPHEKLTTIVATQDVTEIVEENKAVYNSTPGRWKEAFNHVASIPIGLYFELKRKGIVDDQKTFKRWLNDRDNRAFRTRSGII